MSFTNDINHLVFQMNQSATQKQDGGIQFEPAVKKGMKQFIVISILMGIKKLPEYKSY
jgi:hypothetical protein